MEYGYNLLLFEFFEKWPHISTRMFDCVCASPSLGGYTEHAVGRREQVRGGWEADFLFLCTF